MKLHTLNEKIKSLSDENIDIELTNWENIKTYNHPGFEVLMKLGANFVVIETKDKKFIHIDIENDTKIVKEFGLVLTER